VGFWIADSFNINTWMISSANIVDGLSWWQVSGFYNKTLTCTDLGSRGYASGSVIVSQLALCA
jgi:hypothetical protein